MRASACRQKSTRRRLREIRLDFAEMNSSAYDGTVEFISAKSAQSCGKYA